MEPALSRSVLASIVLALGGLCGFRSAELRRASAQPPLSAGSDDVRASLESWRDQFSTLSGARQTWAISAYTEECGESEPPPNASSGPGQASAPGQGTVVDGVFTITVGGHWYRYRLETAQPAPFATHYEVAYNGAQYQLLDREASVLSFQVQDTKLNPMGLANPLMLPWDFLSRDDDDCDSCALRVVDLQDPAVWSRVDQMVVVADDPLTLTTVVQFPGGVLDGVQCVFRVRLVGEPGSKAPACIQRVVAGNQTVLTQVDLSEYQWFSGPGGTVYFPTTMIVSAQPEPGCSAVITYQLTAFELPGLAGLGSSPFTIDPASAAHVWDSDAQQIVP